MRPSLVSLALVSALVGCQPLVVQEHGGDKVLSTDGCSGLADGTPCDDGNACTQTDRCSAGVCVGGDPVECTAAGLCRVAGSCDPATGECSSPLAADGARCDLTDGSGTGVCASGACTAAVCQPGFGDCNHDAADGCEHDVTSDAHNCGACGVVCADDYRCVTGYCVNECVFAVGTVDQSLIVDSFSSFDLSIPTLPSVGQTIVTGKAGQLTAVGLGLHRCGSQGSADVRLTVYDSQDAAIATAVLPSSSIPDDCTSGGESASDHAGTLFDLASLCVPVDAGATLTLHLSLENVQQQTCGPNNRCGGDSAGQPCFDDSECSFTVRADVGNAYAAGTLLNPDGSVDSQDDLTFQTFVK